MEDNNHLKKLSQTKEYRIAKSEPDVRGWHVTGADQQRLGRITDLILDPEMHRVRYLEVMLEPSLHNSKEDRYILLPIGKARILRDSDEVLVDTLDSRQVNFYPVYGGEPITRHYEHLLRDALRRDTPRKEHHEGDEEPLIKMRNERDIARAERDILRSEIEMLKTQLRKARQVLDDKFYEHESFDERQFYEQRHAETQANHL
jgi:hypothetical protein